jgi:hypothetical protein
MEVNDKENPRQPRNEKCSLISGEKEKKLGRSQKEEINLLEICVGRGKKMKIS